MHLYELRGEREGRLNQTVTHEEGGVLGEPPQNALILNVRPSVSSRRRVNPWTRLGLAWAEGPPHFKFCSPSQGARRHAECQNKVLGEDR